MILDSFIRFLTFEKRYSQHTIKAYQADIAQYQSYLLDTFDEKDLLGVSSTFIRSWMVYLIQSGLDVRSIRRKRSVLNTFYNFALKHEHLDSNPMDQVLLPKMKKKLPTFLRRAELELLDSVLPEMSDYASARDRTIIELLLATGMRRAELIGLKISDVRLEERAIRVFGKRKKERIVPITDSMRDSLVKYFEFREQLETLEKFVFVTDRSKPLYPKFVYNLVKRYLGMVTSADGSGPHMLRHTFATLMLDEGADINAIKELLGHADLNATQVYTHTSIEKLKESYRKAHPKAGLVR